jgi:hypothetical protein
MVGMGGLAREAVGQGDCLVCGLEEGERRTSEERRVRAWMKV